MIKAGNKVHQRQRPFGVNANCRDLDDCLTKRCGRASLGCAYQIQRPDLRHACSHGVSPAWPWTSGEDAQREPAVPAVLSD